MSTMEPDEGNQADDQQADAPRWERAASDEDSGASDDSDDGSDDNTVS